MTYNISAKKCQFLIKFGFVWTQQFLMRTLTFSLCAPFVMSWAHFVGNWTIFHKFEELTPLLQDKCRWFNQKSFFLFQRQRRKYTSLSPLTNKLTNLHKITFSNRFYLLWLQLLYGLKLFDVFRYLPFHHHHHHHHKVECKQISSNVSCAYVLYHHFVIRNDEEASTISGVRTLLCRRVTQPEVIKENWVKKMRD